MNPVMKLLLCAVMVESLLCPVSSAQELSLQSRPPGTYVSILGPISISGRAPLSLTHLPVGEYSLTAQGPGLAAARGRFVRGKNGLSFRPWAGPSALLQPPGLVHLNREEGRGWYYVIAATASGIFWGTSYGTARDADSVAEADEKRVRNIWGAYFASIWVGAGIEAWLFTPQPRVSSIGSGQQLATFPAANRWKAALGSVLAPGAGQRYMGDGKRGTVFSSVVAAAAMGTIFAQDEFLKARREEAAAQRRLEEASTPEDTSRAQAELDSATSDKNTKSLIRWVLAGSAAYLYLWNVFDAFLTAQRAEAAGPTVSLAPTPSGLFLTLRGSLP